SLLVGRYDNDIYRSFIRFNFDDWSSQNTIIDVKLRLYYLGNLPANGKLELFTVNSSWTETGITHNNRPSPKDLITVDYVNYPQGKYIEFEFTDITVDWVKNKIVNNGFLIRAPIEVSSELFVFRSRESSTPPELVVTSMITGYTVQQELAHWLRLLFNQLEIMIGWLRLLLSQYLV